MTNAEKNKVLSLRNAGAGYRTIAKETGINLNTITSFLRRNDQKSFTAECEMCRKSLTMTPHKKAKRFCSDKCRMAWWNSHPECVKRKTTEKECLFCGEKFKAIRENNKFCSRSCYANYRKKASE